MSKLKPLVFSINDLAYIDEPRVKKNFQNPHDHAVYKATEVDAHIAELKEKHKMEVEQLLIEARNRNPVQFARLNPLNRRARIDHNAQVARRLKAVKPLGVFLNEIEKYSRLSPRILEKLIALGRIRKLFLFGKRKILKIAAARERPALQLSAVRCSQRADGGAGEETARERVCPLVDEVADKRVAALELGNAGKLNALR